MAFITRDNWQKVWWKKKLYLINLTNFGSETLAILGIRITLKLNSITKQVKSSKAW